MSEISGLRGLAVEMFGAIVLALILGVGWMCGLTYIDFRVARYQRRYRQQFGAFVPSALAAERLLAMPWKEPMGAIVGVVVFTVNVLSAIPGLWLLLVVNLTGLVTVAIIVSRDGPEIQSRSGAGPQILAWLYGLSGEYAGRWIPMCQPDLTIGRDPTSTLLLQAPSVSRRHALICYNGGQFSIYDQASSRGTYVNRVLIQAVALQNGDQIAIGDTILTFQVANPKADQVPLLVPPAPAIAPTINALAYLHGLQGEFASCQIAIYRTEFVIGRAPTSDLVLRDPTVSRQHARICYIYGQFIIYDESSSHDTFVNQERISCTYLRAGDQIAICMHTFEFRPGG